MSLLPEMAGPQSNANNPAAWYTNQDGYKPPRTVQEDDSMLNGFQYLSKDWDRFSMANKVLYGVDLQGGSSELLEVSSAELPVFELTTTRPDVYFSGALHPIAEVCDTPSISVTEVNSEFQRSLVENAFSAKALKTMSSQGLAEVSASDLPDAGLNEGEHLKEYHAAYNFPRIKLFLDESTLKVSQQCDAALIDILHNRTVTIEQLVNFNRRFGAMFTQEVVLGGRLESAKAAHIGDKAEMNAFKAAFAATVMHGPSAASARSYSSSHGDSAISYTPRGGDPLLFTNPTAWAQSLGDWGNWRIIQREKPVSIVQLLSRFPDYRVVEEVFDSVLRSAESPKLPITEKMFDPAKPWTGKICLWLGNKRVPGWTLSVRNGDPENKGTGILQRLKEDYPVLLFKGDASTTPGRYASTVYVDKSSGILCPQTDHKGTCRFSFRRDSITDAWNPKESPPILNGDRLTLWCHSVGLGEWFSLDDPPTKAFQAVYNKKQGLRFSTKYAQFTPSIGYKPAVFIVEFVPT